MSSFYELIEELRADMSLSFLGFKHTNGDTRICAAFYVLNSSFYIFLMLKEKVADETVRLVGLILERNDPAFIIKDTMDVLIGCRISSLEHFLDVMNETEVAKSIIFNLDLFTK